MRSIVLFLSFLFISFSFDSKAQVQEASEDEDILRVTFVTERNGISFYSDPLENSEVLGKFEYSTKLEVLGATGNWFHVRSIGYDLGEGYVLKSGTGKASEIRLDKQDLYTLSSASKIDMNGNAEALDSVSGKLRIELVDQSVYQSKRKEAVDFLIRDTLTFQKEDGVLKVKCAQKTRTYIDKPDAEENMQLFYYIGQIKKLNAYVVFGTYWEEYDFKLIDKTTGQESQTFTDFPYLSADNKHIISLYSNPYEQTGDLALYKVNKQQTNLILTADFKNWMPADETSDEKFWHADGCFYMPVVHSSAFWDETGNLSKAFQYLRIKVL